MITYGVFSRIGGRQENEDYVSCLKLEGEDCFILADGLGGHGSGAEASGLVAECAKEIFRMKEECDLKEQIAAAFQCAQDRLLERQENLGKKKEMKTTMVALVIRGENAAWGHVGDSRLYHFRRHRIQFQTHDHSVPQMLFDTGQIKEKEIRRHPDRNRLLRVLGTEWETQRYELSEKTRVRAGDSFLLCSDGFWELITEKEMSACLKKAGSPSEWLEKMEQIVLKNGTDMDLDNYSAIAVWSR